jgi:lysophospholipase L1-like esterase
MNRFRIPAGKIFLLFFGVFLAFIILEAYLRIYNPFGFRIKNDRIVLPANKIYRFQNKKLEKFDREILIKKNSIGFRGEEPPEGKTFEDFLTIITIGGSTTECSLTSEGKTWTDLLGKNLKASFKQVWINNAGLDGHSTFGHIILMEDYIIRLKPKVLLFLMGGNEIGPRRNVDELEHFHIESKIDFRDPKTIFKRLLAHSEVFNLLRNFYRRFRDQIMPRHIRPIVEVGYSKYEKPLSEWDKLEIPNNDWNSIARNHEPWMERFRLRLKKIVKLSRDNGIEPIFITQPNLFGDCNDEATGVYLGNIKVSNGMNGKTWWNLLELYNDVMRKVGKEESVFVVDLAKKMKKNSLFFADFVHFTNAGQKNVADIVYHELCPFLSKRYPEYSIEKCPD